MEQRERALEILEQKMSRDGPSTYFRERVGTARIASGRLLARLGRGAEALRDARVGLADLEENANRQPAAALTLDLAAQNLLTVEPAELRDPEKAHEYARRAVAQTGRQMPAYLVTLAIAELESGRQEEGRRTAVLALEGYRKISDILAPLFDASKYPEAARFYAEWREELGKPAGLR